MARPRKTKNTEVIENNLTTALGLNVNAFNQLTSQLVLPDTLRKNIRPNLVSNDYVLLSQMYTQLGICAALVDIPTNDGFRGGIHIFSKQLDEDQIEKLSVRIDKEKDLMAAAQACKWSRLYGGGGLIITLSDQDPASPLAIDKITEESGLKFWPCNLWELYFTQSNDGKWNMPTSGEGKPLEDSFYEAAGYVNPEFYQYYTCRLHASRLLKMTGIEAPAFLRGRVRGWGLSVIEAIVGPLTSYYKTADLTLELLDEFKVDVYKFEGLGQSVISAQGTEQIRKRVELVNLQKNFQNAIALDKEDDFQSKNGSFAGLADIFRENRIALAGNLMLPQGKLWGQASSGFSSGEDDLENYASIVEGQVREKVKWHIHKIVELRCQQMFGFVPDDLKISFDSLRIMTSEQEEAVKNSKFTRLMQARERGEITRYEFREACNKEKLLGISLDLAGDDLNTEDPEAQEVIEEVKEESPKEGAGTLPLPSLQEDPGIRANTIDKEIKDLKKISKIEDEESEIKPFTSMQVLEESNAKLNKNTAAFDRASYFAEGGDDWTRGRPKELFEDFKDPALWEKAKERSREAFGREKWEFIAWWYQKHGGKFLV